MYESALQDTANTTHVLEQELMTYSYQLYDSESNTIFFFFHNGSLLSYGITSLLKTKIFLRMKNSKPLKRRHCVIKLQSNLIYRNEKAKTFYNKCYKNID